VQFVELPSPSTQWRRGHPRNPFVESLSLPQLRAIWTEAAQGRSVRWNQVNSSFPDDRSSSSLPDAQFDGSNYFLARSSSPGNRRGATSWGRWRQRAEPGRRARSEHAELPAMATSRETAASCAPSDRAKRGAEAVTPSPRTSRAEVPAPVASDLPLRERPRCSRAPKSLHSRRYYAANAPGFCPLAG